MEATRKIGNFNEVLGIAAKLFKELLVKQALFEVLLVTEALLEFAVEATEVT